MVKNRLMIGLAMVCAVIIAALSFFLFDNGSVKSGDVGNLVDSNRDLDTERSRDQDIIEEEPGILKRIVSLVSGGGGGSSGGGSSGSGSSCSTLQISYALKDFNETVACQSYVNGECTTLFANCSMEINHLDDASGPGTFVVRYDLTDKSNGDILATSTFEESLIYEDSIPFIAEFNLADSNGISENLECAFKTVTIPRKEYCG